MMIARRRARATLALRIAAMYVQVAQVVALIALVALR
jgi:hypothetical protein